MLKNRIRKLEYKTGMKITIEDIIRFIRCKDSLSAKEQRHIISSNLYQELFNSEAHALG